MTDPTSSTPRAISAPASDVIQQGRLDGYAAPGWHFSPVAPALWLALAWSITVAMLYLVGYLGSSADDKKALDALEPLKSMTVDFDARRSARGFSGVILSITVLASAAGLVWAGAAARGKARRFQVVVFSAMAVFLSGLSGLSWWASSHGSPFPSPQGAWLLAWAAKDTVSNRADWIPQGMFALACLVPCVLLCGATFLQQPMKLPKDLVTQPADITAVQADQQRLLLGRVRELDQMLYIGAITLVFGTLQLSAGMSQPLASMPRMEDVKAHADLCKMMTPAAAASAFFTPASAATPAGVDIDRHCRSLPAKVLVLEASDSLRRLVRGITLCVGLAFSALLAAVYVPSLIGLRLMLDKRPAEPSADPEGAGALDPLHRVAAIVATLSPLLAGLLADLLPAA